MGSWSGIPISLHWTFFLLLIIQLIFAGIYSQSWKYCLITFVLYGPILFFMVLLHELGHAWRCRSFPGGSVESIMLWPLGGFTECHVEKGTFFQEFFIAACGPLTHIPQIFLWLLIMAVSTPQGLSYYRKNHSVKTLDNGGAGIFFAELARQAMLLNIILLALNVVVPAYPLDGARLLASFCGMLRLKITKIATIVFLAGMIVGLFALVIGIVLITSGGGPGFLLILLGIFTTYTSGMLGYMIHNEQHYSHPIFHPDCYNDDNHELNQPGVYQLPVPPKATSKTSKKPPQNKDVQGASDKDIEVGPEEATPKPEQPSTTAVPKPGNRRKSSRMQQKGRPNDTGDDMEIGSQKTSKVSNVSSFPK